jgi:Fic family protein
MATERLKDAPGKFLDIGSGRECYLPQTLPPTRDLELGGEINEVVSEAMRELGRLDAISQTIDVSAVPFTSLVRREAIESAAIEGADVDVDEVYQYHTVSDDQQELERDLQEVLNYEKAVYEGIAAIDEAETISIETIHGLHATLLEGSARAETEDVGEFRSGYVRITSANPAQDAFIPCPPSHVETLVKDMQNYLGKGGQYQDLVDLALYQYQFETVHPYEDGNGRLGRLLITLQLYEKGYLSHPYLYPSAYFNRHKEEYVERLEAVRFDGDWEGWVRFFVKGIRQQASEAYHRTLELKELREAYEERYGARQNATQRLALKLFENPYVTASEAQQLLDASKPTVYRAIDALESDGVLTEVTGKQQGKEYKATDIFEIIERPSAH